MVANVGSVSSFAVRQAGQTLSQNVQLLERLSSGLRVNRAADDAASLAIGTRLSAESQSLSQARVNTSLAQSELRVGDGTLARVQDITTRLQTLAVQAGSDNLSDFERGLLNQEFQAGVQEFNRLVRDTQFGGRAFLAGDAGTQDFRAGSGIIPSEDNISVTTPNLQTNNVGQLTASQITNADGTGIEDLGIVPAGTLNTTATLSGASIATRADADVSLVRLQNVSDSITRGRTDLGAADNRLTEAQRSLDTTILNTEAAATQLFAQDYAQGTAAYQNAANLLSVNVSTIGLENSLRGQFLRLLA